MTSAASRPRAGLLFSIMAFLFVAVLLVALGYRLRPRDGAPSALARLGGSERHALAEASLVWITIDGLSSARAGFEDATPPSPTPHLDRLAREAFRFEQAVTPAPSSFAAHAAIMTGRLPAGRDDLAFIAGSLAAGRSTLAEVLRPAGFRTAAFVGSGAVGRLSGLARGFDRFDGPEEGEGPATMRTFAERPAARVVAAARDWVDENFRRRFFMWVQLADPLAARRPPPARDRRLATEYDERIAATDAELGRFLDRLSALGAIGRTIVVVSASHGAGPQGPGGSVAGPPLHDSTILVPALLRLPGEAARDRSIPEQVRLIDFLPTLLELLRVDPPAGLSGRSLVPLLDPGGRLEPLPAVSQTAHLEELLGGARLRALRWGGWKYIEGTGRELYDLERDPGETVDLSVSQPGKVAEMQVMLGRLAGAAASGDAGGPSSPVEAESGIAAGVAALRAGDGSRAARALQDVAQGAVPQPALLALLGAALRLEGRPGEALPLYERAVAPGDGAAPPVGGVLQGLLLSEVGACRRLLGDIEGAVDSYRRAAAALPDDPETRLQLATACLETGRAREALHEYHAAVGLAPGDPRILAGLGRAHLAGGSAAAAVRPLQDAIRGAPGTARPYFDLARAYEALDRPADAARAYEEFVNRAADADRADREQALDRLRSLDGLRRKR